MIVHNNATFTDADFQSIQVRKAAILLSAGGVQILTETRFLSLQRIGDSLKKDNSKGWKTGRFGVGFNSGMQNGFVAAAFPTHSLCFCTHQCGLRVSAVYHVTDLPAFVSGSQLVFFDPQACHLPNVNPSNPGKMINFLAHSDLVTNFPDQIAPFRCFGCDFTGPFAVRLRFCVRHSLSQSNSS